MRLGMRSPTLRTGAGDVHVRAARRTYSGSNPLGAFCGLGRGLVRSDSSAHTSPCRALRRTCPSGRRGHPWCGSTRGRGRVATFRAAPAGSRCSRCSSRRRGPLRNGATGPPISGSREQLSPSSHGVQRAAQHTSDGRSPHAACAWWRPAACAWWRPAWAAPSALSPMQLATGKSLHD
jgi:hypothetical protein